MCDETANHYYITDSGRPNTLFSRLYTPMYHAVSALIIQLSSTHYVHYGKDTQIFSHNGIQDKSRLWQIE